MNIANGTEMGYDARKATYGGKIMALVACFGALAGIFHYVKQANAIRDEMKAAQSQCIQVVGEAAKGIAAQHGVNWKVTDPVRVERSIDRANGPATFDCTVVVMFYPNGASKIETGAEDSERWIVTGHLGKPFTIASARFLGQEQVGQ